MLWCVSQIPGVENVFNGGTVFPYYHNFDLLLVIFVYFEISKDKDYVSFGAIREKGMFLKH